MTTTKSRNPARKTPRRAQPLRAAPGPAIVDDKMPAPEGYRVVRLGQELSEDAERLRALLWWARNAVIDSQWYTQTHLNGIPNGGEAAGVGAALELAVAELERLRDRLEEAELDA